MLVTLSFGYWEIGRYQDAFDLSQGALAAWRELGDRHGEGPR
ncbi:hypothetical protein [Amycolatopsis sp. NPDC054798]